MTPVERLLAAARAEIGYLEKATNAQLDSKTANAGNNNWTKYAAFLDNLGNIYNGKKNGYAWCDMFVDWCFITVFGVELGMKLTCQAYKGTGAGCTGSANYYRNKGQFHTSNPKPGDQIFFTNDGGKTMYHTGVVERVTGSRVYTIEGNTSGASGVVPNGGGVKDKSYPLGASYIGGYGRPDWNLVKEEEDEMTQDKFNEMFMVAMAKYRAELRDNDSSEYSQAAREWAVKNGILQGSGKLPDGTPNFMWEDFMTREQYVTTEYRQAKARGEV